MFNLGTGELLIIFLVILLLFGAKKLPELARGLGKGINEFKDAPVFGKNVIEEATGFLSHGLFQVIRIVGFVLFRIRWHFS